jgi:hypothetical protein
MLTDAYIETSLSQIVYTRLVHGIAPAVLSSEFFARGGYTIVNDFWHPQIHAALVEEAGVQFPLAATGEVTRGSDDEVRGGEPTSQRENL